VYSVVSPSFSSLPSVNESAVFRSFQAVSGGFQALSAGFDFF